MLKKIKELIIQGRVVHCAALAACLALLSGCSEFKMLGKETAVQENDPREDIRLTNVNANLTSSGLVLHHVEGAEARYSQTRNRLTINDVAVSTYEDNGDTQGITRAHRGELFMANDPASGRARNDMLFQGNVRYRSPDRNRPETDTLNLATETLLYNAAAGEFQGKSSHTVVMNPPGKKPLHMRGTQLRVPRDMRRFSMIGGAVGPTAEEDYSSSYTRLSRELEALATSVALNSAMAPPRPTPIQTPQPEPAPERPEPPVVPPMQPSPTPVPRNGLAR